MARRSQALRSHRALRELPWAGVAVLAVVSFGCAGDSDGASETSPPIETSERFPGGDTTNALLFGSNAFKRPASNVAPEREKMFYTGNSFFNSAWVQAPSSTEARDGLGPLFNARSCSSCHLDDGRGEPPVESGVASVGVLLRIGTGETDEVGAPMADPIYGDQLQPYGIDGVPAEGVPTVEYRSVAGEYADGESYELVEPVYSIEDLAYGDVEAGLRISPRIAPIMIGLGLLESIPEERLRKLADPDDADADGISGRVNVVWNRATEDYSVGRFGWKAEQPTIEQQVAGAFLGDIGITSKLFRSENCTDAQVECQSAIEGGTPEIDDDLLERVVAYSRLLAVPARERWDDDTILQGRALFGQVGCADCHVASHETGKAVYEELSAQTIWPYTDLLLHDMGDALSDDRPAFDATGREWRTAPLWGVGRIRTVNGHDRLLHDGRARGVAEAVLWHGGEAETARERFRELTAKERGALVDFVESL